jgi:MoxR-like ATPase
MAEDGSKAIGQTRARLEALVRGWHEVIVGQDAALRGILVAMLSGGHVLIEGVPGLAKTLIVTTLSALLGAEFRRIQFTPDLLPGDLTGTEILNAATGEFTVRRGPVFTNLLLADEINRAPAKVQSALLEAMQERRVTIAGRDLALPELFFVLATQNPIEQEGTFPLPEAQVDRFLLKLRIGYPARDEEGAIVERMAVTSPVRVPEPVMGLEEVLEARALVNSVRLDAEIRDYALALVRATREAKVGGYELGHLVDWGASPRAAIHLSLASRANALVEGRDYVVPDDVALMAPAVLRHRLILSFEAEAEGVGADEVIDELLQRVPVP